MTRLIFGCLFCLILSSCNAQVSNGSTYFFVRHAEKQDDGTKNPHLTEEGKSRAIRLADMLKSERIDAVYSTDYHRTIETAQPVADNKGHEIVIYDPRDFDIGSFLNKTAGQNVLVVGHSNTTPANVNLVLGNQKYPQIDESDYTHFYIVTVAGEYREAVLLHLK